MVRGLYQGVLLDVCRWIKLEPFAFEIGGIMNQYPPLVLTPALEDFIRRRSRPFLEPHKSLETIVACAYIQGMNDAIDALGIRK